MDNLNSVMTWLYCEDCDAQWTLEEYVDCPQCMEEEWQVYLEQVFARRRLERQFRSITPPPDRRRMTTGGRFPNPLR